jgi:hypothetical protein
LEELVVQWSRSVASSTWKTFSVNFCAVTSEADYSFFFNAFFLVFWSNDLAVNFLAEGSSFGLASFALSLNWSITECFFNVFLNLRSHFFCVNGSSIHISAFSLNHHCVDRNGMWLWSFFDFFSLSLDFNAILAWNIFEISDELLVDIVKVNRASHWKVKIAWHRFVAANNEFEPRGHARKGFFKIFLITDGDEITIRICVEKLKCLWKCVSKGLCSCLHQATVVGWLFELLGFVVVGHFDLVIRGLHFRQGHT